MTSREQARRILDKNAQLEHPKTKEEIIAELVEVYGISAATPLVHELYNLSREENGKPN